MVIKRKINDNKFTKNKQTINKKDKKKIQKNGRLFNTFII